MLQHVCVFCGSSLGNQPAYAEAADDMGRLLAERGIELIYGGGNVGLMGRIADACLHQGGRAVGVIPRNLVEKEIAHRSLTKLHVVESMHERKALMADLADAFIALPGGFGTWEEFCEVLTWSQLGLQGKACALLNVSGYYDPLLAMTDRAVAEDFLRQDNRELLLADTDATRLLDRLSSYTVPIVDKWMDRSAR